MDGKQQESQATKDRKEEACMCGKGHVQKSNGCSKRCCPDWSDLVQVSVLPEVSPNKRKRDKALRTVKVIAVIALFTFWEISALVGSFQIFDENVYDNAFLTIANFSFVAIAGWYFCDVILNRFDIME